MASKSVNPVAIANYFLARAAEEGHVLTPMQVIKLAYIAHGWHLAITGDPLARETVEAWEYGPVFPSVYRAFRHFGRSAIGECPWTQDAITDQQSRDVADAVWNSYKQYGGIQLSELTHQVGTPWHEVWSKSGRGRLRGLKIPDSLIRKHYLDLAQRARSA